MAKAESIIFFFALFAIASSLASPDSLKDQDSENLPTQNGISKSMRGFNYLSSRYKPREIATCDKFPRVCRAKGSAGPDCCNKQCVNVMTHNLNCGECGRKCRYGEICCGGNCVDILYDEKNCGACKNKCKKGTFCYYGMCSYA